MPTPPFPVLPIVLAAAAPIEATVPVGVADPSRDDALVEADVPVEADSLRLLIGRVSIPGVLGRSVSSSGFGLE